jgi:hypothetical protein
MEILNLIVSAVPANNLAQITIEFPHHRIPQACCLGAIICVNTRMKCAFALNFIGPVSAIWPRQSVAVQFMGDGGSGKSMITVISTSTWGRDQHLGYKYGFGTPWNTTDTNQEAICINQFISMSTYR